MCKIIYCNNMYRINMTRTRLLVKIIPGIKNGGNEIDISIHR